MICKTKNRKDIIHLEKDGEKVMKWEEVSTTKKIHLFHSLLSSLSLKWTQHKQIFPVAHKSLISGIQMQSRSHAWKYAAGFN